MAAQVFTFRELDAIRSALSATLQHKEQLPLEPEPIEAAFEKVDRVIDDTRYQRSKSLDFLIIPVAIEEIEKEQ